MKFKDKTTIFVAAGKGGNGMVSFKRGKNAPKLGPDGGDGGYGGSVYLVGKLGLNTLNHLRFKSIMKAKPGVRGGSNGKTGATGEDLIIPAPLGTVARDAETGEIIVEVLEEEKPLLVAKGGRRGYGNIRFVSATHQAPQESIAGRPGEEVTLDLELKVIADVGLAGFPNAGKSTLLSSLSAAKPKIADYPFTTLTPQLGVVDVGVDYQSFVMADIPGLIEGASQGLGLGHEFLRHIERTRVIVYVIDGFSDPTQTPEQAFETLNNELRQYDPDLDAKPKMVVINKMDIAPLDFDRQRLIDYFADLDIDVQFISGATQQGLQELKLAVNALIQTADAQKPISTDDVPLAPQPELTAHLPSLDDFQIMPHA